MRDKVFIDTNIWIYFLVENIDQKSIPINYLKKKKISEKIIMKNLDLFVSTQVLSEISNVLIKKYGYGSKRIRKIVEKISQEVELILITYDQVISALNINDKYKFSFYDSLIISSALTAQCNVIYTEDMHHDLKVENSLKIINPFK